jgi:5'-3' exoribonuclease 1
MEHVPSAYRVSRLPAAYANVQDLMVDDASPIIDFYPKNFDLDMNGKKQDWEAVVKIPFIDQERLLRTMNCKWKSRRFADP